MVFDEIKLIRPNYINERLMRSIVKLAKHSTTISSIALRNMRNLIKLLDIEYYSKDNNVYSLLITANVVIDCKLKLINNVDTMILQIDGILSDSFKETKEDIIYPLLTGEFEINKEEERYINGAIAIYLRTALIEVNKDTVIDNLTSLSSGSTINMQTKLQETMQLVSELNRALVNAASPEENDGTLLQLSSPEFRNTTLVNAFESATNPSKVLVTGSKMWNEMLSPEGGFRFASMYLFYGATGSFKSSWMMYNIKWIQKYNSHKYTEEYKKTGVRPVVVYVSLENNYIENSGRYFNMVTGKPLKDFNEATAAQDAWDKYYDVADSTIDVIFYHAPAGKFSVDNLYQLKEDLIERGLKPICWAIDYLKIMKPDGASNEKRIQINDLSKDLHGFIKDDPEAMLMSVHHMNRDADVRISEMSDKQGVNKIKGMGRQHLSESNSIEEPIDFSAFLGLEKSPYDNKTYITINRGKSRWTATERSYFAMPLEDYVITDDFDLPEGKYTSVPLIAAPGTTDELSNFTEGKRGASNLNKPESPKDVNLDTTDKPTAKQLAYRARLNINSHTSRTQFKNNYPDVLADTIKRNSKNFITTNDYMKVLLLKQSIMPSDMKGLQWYTKYDYID